MLLCPAMALTLFAWLGNCYFAEYELPLRLRGGVIFACGTFAYAICWGGSAAAVVWADRIRPQHKAPPSGCSMTGRLLVDPYRGVPSIMVLPEIRGYGRILSAPTGAVETMRLQQPTEYTPSVSLRSAAFNRGMIATGNHSFERFAALCNTPGGSQGVLTFSVCEPVPGQYRTGRVREPMYWYKPCALLSGGTAARADSIRPYWSTSFKTSFL